mmetsp:Transcript_42309/g.68160  ORF Transcript_42309/g.68160 Transcript_42309/m.68160 type:complete len:647 (-) Transcript_42309:287-2227(-)
MGDKEEGQVARRQANGGGEFLYRVVEYAQSWNDRSALPSVCKSWYAWLNSGAKDGKMWRVLCGCLEREGWASIEHFAHKGGKHDLKFNFLKLFHMRNMIERKGDSKFSMHVAVRFRPERKVKDDGKHSSLASGAVIIPLHQRLQMLKATTRNKSELNAKMKRQLGGTGRKKKDTIVVLHKKDSHYNNNNNKTNPESTAAVHCDDSGGAKSSSSSSSSGDAQPQLRRREEDVSNSEDDGKNPSDHKDNVHARTHAMARVVSIDPSAKQVVMLAKGVGLRGFDYDCVMNEETSQAAAYSKCAGSLVSDFLNGFNAALFVYGQTGSGKTHTMFGPERSGEDDGSNGETNGVVHRACEHIMAKIHQRNKYGCQAKVGISYVEVYGEEVTNLLKSGELVSRNKAAAREYVMQGQAEAKVEDLHHLHKLLREGEVQKRRAATAMNERSSRAHTLLIFRLQQLHPKTKMTLESRLILADLGGAEQIKESKVSGERLKEAVFINLGLLALKQCIDALQRRETYVPFGDSQLTKLLSASLGGNSKSGVIICASKAPVDSTMTMEALRFGESCRQIESSASQAKGIALSVMERLNRQIQECEAAIKKKERWENRKVEQMDAIEGKQVFVQSYLAGAEEERKQLTALLAKRNALLGM